MGSTQDAGSMDRRTFLKLSSAGATAVAGGLAGAGWAQEPTPAQPSGQPVYRTLGRTGLKISVVSLGTLRTSEPAVMQAAFDAGVNYIDTARSYQGGNNERLVGQALKGYRDKVFVATKCKLAPQKEEIFRSLEESLTCLQTDYVDVLQLHKPGKEELLRADAKEALAELRKQGKVRYVGVSTHSDEAGVLDAVVNDPDKFYDMVLVKYNFDSPQTTRDAVARAAKANIGIVAMKTQGGGYKTAELGDISPHQAALKFVLRDPNVAAAVPGMVDLNHVKEDTAVTTMDLKVTRRDQEILERYARAIKPYYCRLCASCEPTCPRRVDIPTVNRALMYAEGYGDFGLARATYAEIPGSWSASRCADCAQCTARCPNGLDIRAKMNKARAWLA